MKNNKVSIDLDIEDLLGIRETSKNSLEYDLEFIVNNGYDEYIKQQEEHNKKKQEFIELFKECYDELCIFMEKDPKRRVSVNCFTCIKGMDLRDKYGKPKRKE